MSNASTTDSVNINAFLDDLFKYARHDHLGVRTGEKTVELAREIIPSGVKSLDELGAAIFAETRIRESPGQTPLTVRLLRDYTLKVVGRDVFTEAYRGLTSDDEGQTYIPV